MKNLLDFSKVIALGVMLVAGTTANLLLPDTAEARQARGTTRTSVNSGANRNVDANRSADRNVNRDTSRSRDVNRSTDIDIDVDNSRLAPQQTMSMLDMVHSRASLGLEIPPSMKIMWLISQVGAQA